VTVADLLTRRAVDAARSACNGARPSIWFSQGEDPALIEALPAVVSELPIRPVLVGRESRIRALADDLGTDLGRVTIADPVTSEDLPVFATRLLEMRRRKGLTPPAAAHLVTRPLVFSLMSLRTGRADGVVCGAGVEPPATLRTILRVIGTRGAAERVCGLTLISGSGHLLLAADTVFHLEPDAGELVRIALLAAGAAPALGVEPRVALLSVSDYGSLPGAGAARVRQAAEMLKTRRPDLETDGEMLLATALDPARVEALHLHSRTRGAAAVLVFPDLQSARLSVQLARHAGSAETAPPFIAGLEKPVNVLPVQPSASDVMFLTALTAMAAVV
jgi:malate dehydrogenase (oxaloacetate-decarboxylating)(NADP+)